ncbi:Cyclin-like F-box [Penicillium camemberti]|uniref:Cyclin-like F-box n=1 Tax=Penicillium camemberti (strain FM 013) TaxID=1429867 RepID=A0A0G4PVE6_PENC3|nr:Cyclin-like F-box [Penicillium camemberti]
MIMKTLTRVKSYLTRPNKAISPSEIPRMTTLAGLPPELLLSISDFLPVVDLVCFSVCNRRFFALSQRQIKRLPPRTQDDTLSILNRLERDTPEYFSCEMCNILHRYDGSESFGLSVSEREKTCRLPCVQTRRWFSTSCTMRTHFGITYTQYEFSFLHLRLAMKRFHYGPRSGISTDSLSYTQVRHYPMQSVYPELLSLFSAEAQICPDPLGLYIRMQDIVLVEELDDLIFRQGRSRIHSDPLDNLMPCVDGFLLNFITPTVESLRNGGKASFTYNCQMCNTDIQIEIGEFDSKIAVVLTRWVNLGPGLTQDDILWNTQVIAPYSDSWIDLDDPRHLLTSPRLCFEEMAPQSFEDLRSRNLSHLENQQFKNGKPFTKAGGNRWYIAYKEPSKKTGSRLLRSLLSVLAISRDKGTVTRRNKRKLYS